MPLTYDGYMIISLQKRLKCRSYLKVCYVYFIKKKNNTYEINI